MVWGGQLKADFGFQYVLFHKQYNSDDLRYLPFTDLVYLEIKTVFSTKYLTRLDINMIKYVRSDTRIEFCNKYFVVWCGANYGWGAQWRWSRKPRSLMIKGYLRLNANVRTKKTRETRKCNFLTSTRNREGRTVKLPKRKKFRVSNIFSRKVRTGKQKMDQESPLKMKNLRNRIRRS